MGATSSREQPATPPGERAQRKDATQRRLIDAALDLAQDRSLNELSLREIARAAGIVPTGFYRHFENVEAIGLVVVDESLQKLRDVVASFRTPTGSGLSGAQTAELLLAYVDEHPRHFRVLARERFGGTPAVREAIAENLGRFTSELTDDLGRMPALSAWSPADLALLADLVVGVMIHAVEEALGAPDGRAARDAVVARIQRQLAIVTTGVRDWRG